MSDSEFTPEEAAPQLGTVVSVTGSQAIVALTGEQPTGERQTGGDGETSRFAVGKLIELRTGESKAIGVVSAVTRPMPETEFGGLDTRLVEVELMGELRADGLRGERFHRGISTYPTIDDPAYSVSSEDLEKVYNANSATSTDIGIVAQSRDSGAPVDLQKLLTHHFAFLGASGVGKSCGIVLLLQAIIERFDDFRIFIIDPHNEYKDSFGDKTVTLTPTSMNLPFWLFSFEEIIDVFFLGRPGVDDEVELLREIIPIAKNMYHANVNRSKTGAMRRPIEKVTSFTVDAPVPYRISDLIGIIEQRLGKLENRGDIAMLRRLKTRIETVSQDPRCTFMFGHLTVEDTMADVIGHLFRIPDEGKPISIVELAGLPAEIVDAVVSVLCRLAFDFGLWSDGAYPVLLVAEEAHRYVPAVSSQGFGPTRRAISRIAKEGRKYGLYLGLATQRPAELDPTILSQCGTVFAMRLSNDRDQEIVRAAVPDAVTSQLGFLPALGPREALAIGEAVTMPMRLRFAMLEPTARPRSHARPIDAVATSKGPGFINEVVRRWRASGTQTTEMPEPIATSAGLAEAESMGRIAQTGEHQPARPAPATAGDTAAGMVHPARRSTDAPAGGEGAHEPAPPGRREGDMLPPHEGPRESAPAVQRGGGEPAPQRSPRLDWDALRELSRR